MDKHLLFLSLVKHINLHCYYIDETVRFNNNDGTLEMFFIAQNNGCFHASRCEISKEGNITHHFLSGCGNPSGFVAVSTDGLVLEQGKNAEAIIKEWIRIHQAEAKSGPSTVALLEWLGLVSFQ